MKQKLGISIRVVQSLPLVSQVPQVRLRVGARLLQASTGTASNSGVGFWLLGNLNAEIACSAATRSPCDGLLVTVGGPDPVVKREDVAEMGEGYRSMLSRKPPQNHAQHKLEQDKRWVGVPTRAIPQCADAGTDGGWDTTSTVTLWCDRKVERGAHAVAGCGGTSLSEFTRNRHHDTLSISAAETARLMSVECPGQPKMQDWQLIRLEVIQRPSQLSQNITLAVFLESPQSLPESGRSRHQSWPVAALTLETFKSLKRCPGLIPLTEGYLPALIGSRVLIARGGTAGPEGWCVNFRLNSLPSVALAIMQSGFARD